MNVKVYCNYLQENQKILEFCENEGITAFDVIYVCKKMEKQKSELRKKIKLLKSLNFQLSNNVFKQKQELEKTKSMIEKTKKDLRLIIDAKLLIEKEVQNAK